ncbi:hypothetical protein Tco_0445538 [Tanacetum coccineum]
MKFVRIGEDIQEYGKAIPDMMLTNEIKQSEAYKAFIDYSTGLVPPKKTRGKGSQGKKSGVTLKPTSVEMSNDSDLESAKRQTSSRRKSKKKVSISADDNIIPEPDVALELGKSISLTEAEEEEAARRVHTTHERLVTEFDEPSGIQTLTPEEQIVADTMQALKARKKISKSQPHTRGSSEGTGVSPEVSDELIVILTTSSEETGTKPEVLDDVKKKNDDNDDRSIDITEIDDDEETDDEFVHGDEYVHDDVGEKMKDAEVTETGKDDEEINDAEMTDAKKTKEVNGDNKKAELPLTSSSLSISLGFGNQFLNLSSDKSPVRIIKDSTDAEINSLLDIQIQQEVLLIQSPTLLNVHVSIIPKQSVPIVSPSTTLSSPPFVTNITPVLQQQTTPIPTPPITTVAPNVTTTFLDPLPAIVQRVSVPPAVKKYLGSSVGDALQKKEILFKMIQESKSYEKYQTHKELYDALMMSMIQDEDHLDRLFPDQPKQKKRDHGNSSPKTSKSNKPVHAEESGVVPIEEVIMDAANDNVVIDVNQLQDDSEPKIDKDPKND